MKLKIDKILDVILVLSLAGFTLEVIYLYYHWPKRVNFNRIEEMQDNNFTNRKLKVNKKIVKLKQSAQKDNANRKKITIPSSFTLNIPFVCQAPLGNWGSPFNHACEEASVLMVHYYFQGETVDPSKAAQDIRDMVNFEKRTYGFYKDTSAEQTAQLIRDYYGYRADVHYNVSLKDIKKELVKGNVVIAPTAGRKLLNPYFKSPGPIYHMLVIKGYTPTEFITNDPGTKRGADYAYPYQIIKSAICDWSNGHLEKNKSVIISVQK